MKIIRAMFALILGISMSGCTSIIDKGASWDDTLEKATDNYSKGAYGQACKYYQLAIDKAAANSDARVATVASQYADMQASRGKLQDAELLYKNAIVIDQLQSPPLTDDIDDLTKRLAYVLHQESKEAEAKELLAKIKGKSAPAAAKDHELQWPILTAADETETAPAQPMQPASLPQVPGFTPPGLRDLKQIRPEDVLGPITKPDVPSLLAKVKILLKNIQ